MLGTQENGPWDFHGPLGIGCRALNVDYARMRLRPHPVARVASESSLRKLRATLSVMIRQGERVCAFSQGRLAL